MLIKSKVKYIQSLSQKKFRDETGVFVAEGSKIVRELLTATNIMMEELFATDNWLENNTDVLAKIPIESIHIIDESELERISFLSTPNGVLGVFRKPVFEKTDHSHILMLDGIQDPGNMGTLIRIADWFGIQQIVCSIDSADAFNPKVVQSTMGSIIRVEMVYSDLPGFIKEHTSLPLYITTLNGTPLSTMGKVEKGIIVIGNESKGIRPDIIQLAHHKITIERKGSAESLNAAVAAGIILSHVM